MTTNGILIALFYKPMPAAAPTPETPPLNRRVILLTVCLGAFMATLDTSIVNIALPQIARDFHCSVVQISWVMLIYLLMNVSLLLTSGRLADLLAPGKLFLLGLLVFTGASALCGASPSLAWMVGARAVQGLGASLMLGVAPKLIALTYGEGERGLALGLFSTAFATGISVGAPLGGIITAYLGWPFIFFINLPICAGAFWVGGRVLRPIKAQQAWSWQSFDIWEALILTGTLGLFLLGLNWIQKSGWSAETLGALGLAALLGLGLYFRERRRPDPLLHPELWRRWPFVAGSLAVVLTFAPVMGVFFLLPFFLEQVYHYTPGQSGFMLAALSVSNALVAAFGGYLADRLGNLLILRTGAGLILAGLVSLIFTGPDTSTMSLVARFIVIGLGFGLFQAPNLNEILRGVKPAFIGLAASTNAVLKNLGSLMGITLIVSLFAWLSGHPASPLPSVLLGLGAFQTTFALAALVAVLNLLANLLPRKP
jgi:EmrB/QacA subfamily drug resistance transporter